MRKYFGDLSLTGGVLLFCAFAFGLFLRLYDLGSLSPWSDELATRYFSSHLSDVYFEETHPPLFYALTRASSFLFGSSVASLRLIAASFSVSLCALCVWVARKRFSRAGFLLFAVFLFLLPPDVIHARMARMYAMTLEGTILVFLFYQLNHIKSAAVSSLLLSWVFPLGFFPGLVSGLMSVLKRKWTEAALLFSTVIPVILYFLSKKIFLPAGFVQLYLKGEHPFLEFISEVLKSMAGEAFPRQIPIPLPDLAWQGLGVLFILLFLFVGFLSLREKRWKFFSDFYLIYLVISFSFVVFFSAFFTDILVGRYLLPLIAVPLMLIGDLADHVKKLRPELLGVSLFSCLLIYQLKVIRPFELFFWDDHAIAQFKVYRNNHPDLGVVFCANKFQYDYYFDAPHRHCMHDLEALIHRKTGFVFLDLNGFMIFQVMNRSAKDYQIVDPRRIGNASLALFLPKDRP